MGGRDAIQAQAAYLIGAPDCAFCYAAVWPSPRLAVRSPPSPHTPLPAQTDDSRICLHHRHSLTPTKVRTPSTRPDSAPSPLSHRSIHLVASVASGPQPSSQETARPRKPGLCPFVSLSCRPALQHVNIRCPSDDRPSPGGKPQRQLQATHLHRHPEEVSVCLAPLRSHRPSTACLPIHLARRRRSTLVHILFDMGCGYDPKHQATSTEPSQGFARYPGLGRGAGAGAVLGGCDRVALTTLTLDCAGSLALPTSHLSASLCPHNSWSPRPISSTGTISMRPMPS